MSSLNLNRFCSTKQNGSPSSGRLNSYWLMTSLNRWRRMNRSCSFGSTSFMDDSVALLRPDVVHALSELVLRVVLLVRLGAEVLLGLRQPLVVLRHVLEDLDLHRVVLDVEDVLLAGLQRDVQREVGPLDVAGEHHPVPPALHDLEARRR